MNTCSANSLLQNKTASSVLRDLKKAFAKVSNYSRFNFKQMEFIDVIIDSVAKNGILELNKLSENPQLQNIYSGGIIELFGTETAKEIFSVLKDVNNSVA